MAWIEGTRAVLLDVDGTLLHGDRAMPGAAVCVERLRRAGVPFRFTTNTTRKSRQAVAQALRAAGIEAATEEVLPPSVLARRRIVGSSRRRALLVVPEPAWTDFEGVDVVARDARGGAPAPDWVVVGDIGAGFTWEVLNAAFQALRGGARLLALQKNRFWHAGEAGIRIDAGAFVAALEYAADVEAEVVGKPARAFFDLALEDVGGSGPDALVVGDDLDNDGRGAAAAGCRTALVRTGKFDAAALAASGFRPDLLLDSVADLEPPGVP